MSTEEPTPPRLTPNQQLAEIRDGLRRIQVLGRYEAEIPEIAAELLQLPLIEQLDLNEPEFRKLRHWHRFKTRNFKEL